MKRKLLILLLALTATAAFSAGLVACNVGGDDTPKGEEPEHTAHLFLGVVERCKLPLVCRDLRA